MIKKRYLVALGALSAALGACGASEYKTPPHGSGAGSSGGSTGIGGAGSGAAGNGMGGSSATGGKPGAGGSTSAGSSSGGSTSVGGAAGSPTGGSAGDVTCTTGIPATSQVPRMKNVAYDNVIRDLLGVTTLTAGSLQPPSSLLYPDYDGDLTPDAWSAYLRAADQIASAVVTGDNRSKFLNCDPATTGCLTDTIKSFGRKAFRRPLTDTEVTSFSRLLDVMPAGTPDEIATAILYTFLASPSFIMLPELGSDTEGDAIKLTSWEVATRLSFLLWNSVPDGALADAADNAQLQTKDQILAQAQRMLKDDRAQAVLIAFGRAYLGMTPSSHWNTNVGHDTTKFPKFSAAAVSPMLAELDSFFEDVTFRGGSFKDLLLSDVGFVNRDTAALYGLDATKYTSDLMRVELDATQRPGLLTRVGFLGTFSHFDTTAPVLRGAFIATRILGLNPGDDPPSPQPPTSGQYTTERAAVEALTESSPTCQGCHEFLDPPGFVLEHYDTVGSWQDQDPLGGPIDGTADVILDSSDTTKMTIKSPLELMTALANSSGAQHRFAEQLVSYATGRSPNPLDDCTVESLAQNLENDGYPVVSLFADYTQADSFRLRTVGN
jgi:hypothetical protein